MASVLKHFDRERYDLFSYAIMPNHVHVVMRCLGDCKLQDVLHSWKSFSATKLNRMLERHGSIWQREYFDHLLRHQSDLAKFCKYVKDNPVKANLKDWPWVWVADEVGFLP
jgi:REP element-mobilizing transposase RayT